MEVRLIVRYSDRTRNIAADVIFVEYDAYVPRGLPPRFNKPRSEGENEFLKRVGDEVAKAGHIVVAHEKIRDDTL